MRDAGIAKEELENLEREGGLRSEALVTSAHRVEGALLWKRDEEIRPGRDKTKREKKKIQ